MNAVISLRIAGVVLTIAATGAMAQARPQPTFMAGWTDAHLAAFTAECTESIVVPARTDYAAAAARAGNANPKPFPEDDLRASVTPMCGCLAVRVAETWALDGAMADNLDKSAPFVREALAGGRCKPGGLLGEMLASPPRHR